MKTQHDAHHRHEEGITRQRLEEIISESVLGRAAQGQVDYRSGHTRSFSPVRKQSTKGTV